jgi:internalin A
VKYTFKDLQKIHRVKEIDGTFVFDDSTKDLEFVDLSGNKELKVVVFSSPQNNLKYLDLSYCSIIKIVFSENCKNIQTIYLHHNQLRYVEFKGYFPFLELVDLSFNKKLAKLRISQKLPALNYLYLHQCNFKDLIPLAEYFIKPGFDFNIGENKNLQSPPLEIVKSGREAVIGYFSSFWPEEDEHHLYEARILIIGEGGAGKTTLARRILDKNAPMPDEKDSTAGIDVSQWSFEIDSSKGPRNMRVNVWDFGGQSIYKATHRFFLSNRVLYILLTDGRKEDTDFNYWLNLAEMFGGDSPLVIVMNIKEGREYNIPMNILRGRFANLKDEVRLDLKEIDKNYDVLINKLKHHISELPHIGTKLPESWTLIRKDIEQIEDKYIYHSQFFAICEKHGVTELDTILQISQFFHDIGVFLHFQDSPQLGKILFLKNSWALDAAYAIIDAPEIRKRNGHFTKKDAIEIWGKDYFMVYEELLALMKRFYLIYEINNSQSYIAPQLLLDDRLDYQWDTKDNLQLRYEYDDFMPQGILWQFIAIMHKKIKNNTLVWRSGVILSEGDTEAEVTEVYGQHKINIRIKGKNKLDFRTIIAYELDKINQQYAKLKYEKKVPCICPHCTKGTKPHFFNYSTLKNIAERGKRNFVYCDKSDEEVSVKKLLEGVELPKSVGSILSDTNVNSSNRTKPEVDELIDKLDKSKIKRLEGAVNESFKLLAEYERELLLTSDPETKGKIRIRDCRFKPTNRKSKKRAA